MRPPVVGARTARPRCAPAAPPAPLAREKAQGCARSTRAPPGLTRRAQVAVEGGRVVFVGGKGMLLVLVLVLLVLLVLVLLSPVVL